MNRYMIRDLILAFVILISVVTFFWGILYGIPSYQCTSRWDESFNPEYKFVSGCILNVNGKKIPAKNFREF